MRVLRNVSDIWIQIDMPMNICILFLRLTAPCSLVGEYQNFVDTNTALISGEPECPCGLKICSKFSFH